jgi:aminomethyltransferase
MCYPDGGTVDDLLIYKYSQNEYFLVINASNIGLAMDAAQQRRF